MKFNFFCNIVKIFPLNRNEKGKRGSPKPFLKGESTFRQFRLKRRKYIQTIQTQKAKVHSDNSDFNNVCGKWKQARKARRCDRITPETIWPYKVIQPL